METLFPHILKAFEENRPAVLATLIKRTGSAPRDAGTRFVVLEDGRFQGTIGGGTFEARVLQEARRVIESGRASRYEFHLTGEDVEDTEMICGGEGEVFLEPVLPGNSLHVQVFERALEVLRSGGAGVLATALDPDRWSGDETPKAFMEFEGDVLGSLLGQRPMPQALVQSLSRFQGKKQTRVAMLEDGSGGVIEVLLEPVAADPTLYVFGGGHVASQIAPLAARVGFQVVVIDDRAEFADPARFPEAHQVIQAPFEGLMEQLSVDPASYLVIVTRGHSHDKEVLAQALDTDARYVGMIGSNRKIGIIFNRLREEGISQGRLDRVHSPIGIDIGAETPEEIAVSIVAELIRVRAGGGKRGRSS